MKAKDQFSGSLGFVVAAAGSAVGLGNIWGFPYEVGQGGGALFVLVYLFFCFTLCLPVMLVEIAIGRKSGSNPVHAFKVLGFPKWRFIGFLGLLSGVVILSYYNVIAGWAFGYIFEMVRGNFQITQSFDEYTADYVRIGLYGLLFMSVTSFFVSRGIAKGIERVAKVLMPVLILMIIGVAAYALTLEDAMAGLQFYLLPKFSSLEGKVIYNAMGQAFFSLSLGMGALITYGSYVRSTDNLLKSASLITLADVGIALLAGLMIFPLIGHMSGGTMEGVSRGPELIFVTIPAIFGTIGGGTGQFVGTAFFLLLCFAALTSTISLLEVPVSYVTQATKLKREKATWLVAFVVFLVGIPSLLSQGASDYFGEFIQYMGAEQATNFMDFMLNLANDTFLPLGGCLMVCFAVFVWKKRHLDEELSKGYPGYHGSFYQRYLHFSMTYVIPVLLGILCIYTVLSTFFGL
ncbi:MAG: sodium-dependent transporter [Cytophagales bacterium]|nr:sodium-dependent transporter [Cytophagales bacterium]